MRDVVLVSVATMLATGLGVLPIAFLGAARADRLAPILWSAASAIMLVAAVGLLLAGLDRGAAATIAGAAFGAGLLIATRRLLGSDPTVPAERRRAELVIGTLFLHSLPEGLAIGAAMATGDTLGLVAVVAIGLQNIPEGTAAAVPLARAGVRRRDQFGAAVLTSATQPIGAVVAYLATDATVAALPLAYGAAAGAMGALVIAENRPARADRHRHRSAT